MTTPIVTVSGTLNGPGGDGAGYSQLTFTLSPDATGISNTLMPHEIRVRADDGGAFSIEVAPYAYRLTIRDGQGRVLDPIDGVSVPDLNSIPFATLFSGVSSHDWGLTTESLTDGATDWGRVNETASAADDWGTL